ncbi:MAG TPA: DNA gyrase inhibitor YacG [Usitatibacter sp.]|nr:DNA gyrase inhibitor YacG [Usitatibacter sp.]
MSAPAAPARVVSCPGCGKPASLGEANAWRPFCSERCRRTDLGAWASEAYRVEGKPAAGEDGPEGGGGEP